MKKQTSEIEEIPPKYPDGYIMKGEDGNLYMLFDKNWWSIQEGHSFDIQYILQDEKKKWKEEVMKELGLNTYTVGIASARREDLGTPKADPESEYNKGYRDATNKMNEWLRVKLNNETTY